MTRLYDELPITFSPLPRVPAGARRARAFRRRVWIGLLLGLALFWAAVIALLAAT